MCFFTLQPASQGDVPLISVASIYRYPIKGFSPERLASVQVTAGETLPGDRLYAIENGPGKFDPTKPRHLPKVNFFMLMRNAQLASLDTHFDDAAQRFEICRDGQMLAHGQLNTPAGRAAIEGFLSATFGDTLRGAPKVVHAQGHSFSDVKEKCIHIITRASLRRLESVVGRNLSATRFRPNLVLDGTEPWQEFAWLGRRVTAGDVTLRVFKRTQRCAAVDVDPDSGARDTDLLQDLRRTWGHSDFGVYATIEASGTLREGTELKVSD